MRGLDALQRADQTGAKFPQLAGMVAGECSENLLSLRRNFEQDAPPVCRVFPATEQHFGHRAIDEFDDAVVTQPQPFSRISDGEGCIFRRTGNLQQKLVLLGVKMKLLGRMLAELKEVPELIAELGERLKEGSRVSSE